MKKFQQRSTARKCVLQALYSYYFNCNSQKRLKQYFFKKNKNRIDKSYYNFAIFGIPKKMQLLNKFLLNLSIVHTHITVKSIIDLVLLRMFAFEFLYLKNIPKKTIFFEILQLAEEFGTLNSCVFLRTVFNNF